MSWTTEEESEGWSTKVPVIVDGEETEVDIDDPFVDTVKEIAREHGLKTFRVFIDDEEVLSPSEAPQNFEGINSVKIVKKDKPA